MTPLKSSALQGADYDPATQTLIVTFTSGQSYTYAGVPSEVFRGLTTADSAGAYFQNTIRPSYEGTKMEESAEI